ncbi:GNAT family N-acetyltransferase [Acinetobacter baumannii]|uniref:GNAT family N-acetyltransferase n=1 Tax=Acinetobacter baumannii TaxID=470 RepID=UPI00207B109A|nr:GNAT family N-acetyltransferase [Acinetobacter baumannii]
MLNDLYVHEVNRRQGIAEELMQHVIQFGKIRMLNYLALETHFDNVAAQTLYKNIGNLSNKIKTKLFEYSY